MRNDLEEEMLKSRVLSKNNTFKTAFKATLGFYAGQFVATVLGLLTIGLIGSLIYILLHNLK